MLKDDTNHTAVRLLAAKMITTAYLNEQSNQHRMKNLQREIAILELADPSKSVSLVEALYTDDRVIIVQDLCNGGTLNNFLGTRESKLSETELRLLIKKLTKSVNDVHVRNFEHRDLNIDNVMLHFPQLEPCPQEL